MWAQIDVRHCRVAASPLQVSHGSARRGPGRLAGPPCRAGRATQRTGVTISLAGSGETQEWSAAAGTSIAFEKHGERGSAVSVLRMRSRARTQGNLKLSRKCDDPARPCRWAECPALARLPSPVPNCWLSARSVRQSGVPAAGLLPGPSPAQPIQQGGGLLRVGAERAEWTRVVPAATYLNLR